MITKKTNWTAMILLILGLSTIVFPLYLTLVIAFKQPAEMTNSISGILSLPKAWSLDNFREADAGNRFLELLEKQFDNHSGSSRFIHSSPFHYGICPWKK